MNIKLRPFNKETDAGFIIDSMPKELHKDRFPKQKKYKKNWFEQIHYEVMNLIEDSKITMACAAEDDDFLLGYVIDDQYVHVKENYQRQGIATLLFYGTEPNSESKYITELGKTILKQKKEAVMTDHETQSDGVDKAVEKLIKSGFAIRVAKFDPALTSGYGTAENEYNGSSTNKMKVPDKMFMTPVGVMIFQNGKIFGGNAYSWSV